MSEKNLSFYVVKPDEMAKVAMSEHVSLKDAEKALRAAQPGDYLIVKLVRLAHTEFVPESVRVVTAATSTRARRSRVDAD